MKIVIQPYQITWPEEFEKRKAEIEKSFAGLNIHFYHIGSTSIPHCSAKPIIDILGVTPDITQVDSYNHDLIQLGYEPKGEYGMRGRRFFYRRPSSPVNLHIFEDTNPEVERHLRFRDYMKNHPAKIQEYSQLKQQLAQKFPNDIEKYILGKEKWIKEIDIAAAQAAFSPIASQFHKLRKSRWSQSEILKAMENNMHLQMTYFAKYISNVEMIFEPDVTVVRSAIQDDTFNYVLFASFTETNVRERVSHVINLYQPRRLPFSWWVGEQDMPKNLADHLLEAGLHFKEENVGMYLTLENTPAALPSSELEFHRVDSQSNMQDFCGIITDIGGHPQAYELIYSELPSILYRNDSSIEMHMAYLNGKPIVTGILVLDANVAGIYYVATVPEQRGKGFGTTMMKNLLARAQDKGYFVATLQASRQGKSLYERLGFKQCCVFKEYATHSKK